MTDTERQLIYILHALKANNADINICAMVLESYIQEHGFLSDEAAVTVRGILGEGA